MYAEKNYTFLLHISPFLLLLPVVQIIFHSISIIKIFRRQWNFFICLNLNKKVVLKIIQQHKDLILYHWNCFSISNFYVFRYKKKIACKSIIPYWFIRNFYTFIKKLKTSFFKNTHYKINVILYVSVQNTNFLTQSHNFSLHFIHSKPLNTLNTKWMFIKQNKFICEFRWYKV